jgi:hypothetical protein
VQQQVASAASANFVWATERARWLARQVATHFDDERDAVLPALRTEASAALGAVREMKAREGESYSFGGQALTALRGGYIGVLMFGFLGTIVGLSLINPFSIGAGLLLGGKTISDERRRIVTRRQAEAKTVVRRYVDDVTFQVGKDSRDMLRHTQRQLRDHYSALAEEVSTSIASSVLAAQNAVNTTTSERQSRIRDLKAELARIDALADRARGLVKSLARTS